MIPPARQRLRSGLWPAIVCAPARHPWPTLLLVAVCVLLSILGVRATHFEASLENMMSQHDPSATALVKVMGQFGAVEDFLVLVSVPPDSKSTPGENAERLVAFGARLVQQVQHSPAASALIDDVMYRADPQSIDFVKSVLVPAGAYYLDDPTFAAVRQRLTPHGIRDQIQRDEAILSMPGPAGAAMSKIILQDPLRLHEFILKRLSAQRPFDTFEGSDAFLTPDGRSLLIRIVGKKPPSDLAFAKALTAQVEDLTRRANIDGLTVQLTGAYAIAAESERSIKHDMVLSVIASVLLMQVLFLLAYRSPTRFALAFLPVAVGVLVGLGAHSLFSTTLTPMTAVIGAMLAGMGIDYTVQYLSQYEQARSDGLSPLLAAERTSLSTTGAIMGAWATTVIGFLAICGSSIPALRDFAVVGSLGLGGAFLAAVVMLPALLRLLDRRHESPAAPQRLRFRLDGVIRFAANHPAACLAAMALLLLAAAGVVAGGGAHVLAMSSDLTVLHPHPNRAIEAQLEVGRRFRNPTPLIVLLEGKSPEDLLRKAYTVQQRLNRPALQQAGIARTAGLAMLLPNPDLVPHRQAELKQLNVETVLHNLRAALADSVLDPDRYVPQSVDASQPGLPTSGETGGAYAGFLRRLLRPGDAPGVQTLVKYPKLAGLFLPRAALAPGAPPPTRAITLIFTDQPLTRRATRDAVLTTVRSALAGIDGATLTGMSVISHDGERLIRRDLPRLFLLALALVMIYLLAHFRSLRDALLALLPALFALLCVMALMRLTGQQLNLVNLIAGPLLIGICVDYPIFMISLTRLDRQRSGGREQLIARLASSGHAVLICSITTILGFGSLAWTSVPAVRSLGLIVASGVAASVLAALFFLVPLLLHQRQKTPPPER